MCRKRLLKSTCIAVSLNGSNQLCQPLLAGGFGDEWGYGQGMVKDIGDVEELEPDFPVGCCHCLHCIICMNL